MDNREKLFNILNPIAPVNSVGTISGYVEQDLLVLRQNMNLVSMNTSCAGWDQWTIEVYSPTSPQQVAKLAKTITKELTNNGYEIINRIGGDNYDPNYRAFYSMVTLRAPQTYI